MVATSVGIGKFSVSIGKTPFTDLDQSFSLKVRGGAIGVGGWVGVGVTVGVGIGVGSGVRDGEGVGVGVATGEGFLVTTPLFQTSLFPVLTQVNFFPLAVAVVPALLHFAPALGVAAWTGAVRDKSKAKERMSRNFLFTVTAFSLCLRRIRNLVPYLA